MKQLALTTTIVLATLGGLWMFWELRTAVLIFFLSLGTSAALRPAIEWLVARRVPKWLALAVTYLACVVAVAGLIVALVFPVAADLQRVRDDLTNAYRHVTGSWPEGNALERAVVKRLPSLEELPSLALGTGTATIGAVLGATLGVFGAAVHVVIIFVLSLYWSIDRVHFERLWLSLLSVEKRTQARDVWRAVEHAIGAYLQREAAQSLSAGLMLGVGFWALGQPYAVLSAAIGALAWLIPYVGAFLAMLSVMAISLPNTALVGGQIGTVNMIGAAAYTLLVLLLLELFVEPRLFHRRRYNPILLVLVAVGMADWMSVLGLLLAPPVAATIQILGGQFLQQRDAPPARALDLASHDLAGRWAALRARLADLQDPPEEIKSMVNRLDALVNQARDVLAESPAQEA
ncbi:MAG: AI-2E family transporter [Planctomycetia bacterium]|nr:AI-2E family transporter [Planctomycetia bacterium]